MRRNHKNHIGSPCKSVFDFLLAMKKTRQMQAHILFLTRIEIPALVGNFEFKTLSRGGELWIEILSQGLGRVWPQSFVFDQSLHPFPRPPPPSGITLIAAWCANG